MAVESAADRAVFFDTDEFGTAATWTPSGGSAATVNGVFDSEYQEVGVSQVGVALAQPRFVCRTADASTAAEGDTLLVGSTTYTIRVVQADGTGLTTMVLEG